MKRPDSIGVTRKVGVVPKLGEAPISFAKRVRQDNGNHNGDVESVTEDYLNARYGPANPESLKIFRDAVNEFAR